jgi:hypothetical protein
MPSSGLGSFTEKIHYHLKCWYRIVPPDYTGEIPPGYFAYRSGTYGVFVLWRGFFKNPHELAEPVKVMEQRRIYPQPHLETQRH